MRIVKKLLIIISIITIILAIALIYISANKNKNTNNINVNVNINNIDGENNTTINQGNIHNTDFKKAELVNDRNKYFVVENIINTYTNNNVYIKEMYYVSNSENIDIFLLKTIIKDTKQDTEYIVITDAYNNTFLVWEDEEIKLRNYNLEKLSQIQVDIIEKDENNSFKYKSIDEQEYVKDLFKSYIKNALNDVEFAYEYLNKEYREAKFDSLEKYSEFIENNRRVLELYDSKNIKQVGEFESFEEWDMYFSTIRLLEVEKYLIKEREGYTEYTIIDSLGNYYIFNEKSVMNYEVILDTYTIDIAQFIEKYDSGDTEVKTEMNITRFLDAINRSDYEYAYNKLEENFKNDNFPTIEEFAKYIDESFIYFEEIDYSNFSETEGVYSFLVELKYDEKIMQKTITLEPKEGRDYRISFDVM